MPLESYYMDHFYLFRKFVAIGLLQGVPGPHCFCKPLVEYILSDDVTASTITVQFTDVPVFLSKGKYGRHLKCTIGGRVSIMFE